MADLSVDHAHYKKIQSVIELLSQDYQSQPALHEIASKVGMSPYHLQRTFNQWAGISPKQFIGFLTKEHAKSKLKENSVLDAALSSGLSGGGRLHDLMVTYDAVTPGEYKSKGRGMLIEYGVHHSPFGYCLLAATSRGVCHLSFFNARNESNKRVGELQQNWCNAEIVENPLTTEILINKIFGKQNQGDRQIKILFSGTPFKMKVWEALLKIPIGALSSYQQVAMSLGMGHASRAVATAVACNNIAYVIPCHRVIKSTGILHAYRWGAGRKAAIIGWEGAKI